MENVMGSDIFQRLVANEHGIPDDERHRLTVDVWSHTPWIVDAYTGRESLGERDRDYEIRMWCAEQFGPEGWPIHGRPGRWYRGSVTIHGWTWIGFDTEEAMKQFIERWPAPEPNP